MSDKNPSAPQWLSGSPVFATTHWSVVLKAGQSDTSHAQEALSQLCQTYWYPLYVYVRRRGVSAHDAQDLTQAFFERLLERDWTGDAHPARGRFRTFLLTAISRFMSDQWDKANAQKRGGGVTHVALQLETGETRYGLELADDTTPEQCFERRWALTLLDNVLLRLQTEYRQEGKEALFSHLHSTLAGRGNSPSYAGLGDQLGMSEGAIKVAVHRLRKRYRQLLREEISRTIDSPDDVDEELRHLFAVLAGK